MHSETLQNSKDVRGNLKSIPHSFMMESNPVVPDIENKTWSFKTQYPVVFLYLAETIKRDLNFWTEDQIYPTGHTSQSVFDQLNIILEVILKLSITSHIHILPRKIIEL